RHANSRFYTCVPGRGGDLLGRHAAAHLREGRFQGGKGRLNFQSAGARLRFTSPSYRKLSPCSPPLPTHLVSFFPSAVCAIRRRSRSHSSRCSCKRWCCSRSSSPSPEFRGRRPSCLSSSSSQGSCKPSCAS